MISNPSLPLNYLKYRTFLKKDKTISHQSFIYNPGALVNLNAVLFQLDKIDFEWKFYDMSGHLSDNEIPIGYIQKEVRLYPSDGRPFQVGFSLSYDSKQSFLIDPTYLRAELNQPYLKFRIGALSTTQAGIFQLQFIKLGEKQIYTDYPPAL